MTKRLDRQEPAFPNSGVGGLTKREWMATTILAGILANPQNRFGIDSKPKNTWAQEAVWMTDALLNQLAEEPNADT